MNRVIMIGRLARDPELRYTASGKAVSTFTIAVNRPFSKEKEADFFNVVVWGKSGENCANFLKKGRLVGIDGRLQSRSYETQAGDKRYVTEIIAEQVEFLDFDKDSSKNTYKAKDDDFGSVDIDINDFQSMDDDEDIPF